MRKGGDAITDTTKRGLGSTKIDNKIKHDIQSKGGQASSSQQDMSALGKRGGKAAQKSGHAHQLTNADRSKGGQVSSSKQDMRELGRRSGEA